MAYISNYGIDEALLVLLGLEERENSFYPKEYELSDKISALKTLKSVLYDLAYDFNNRRYSEDD